MFVSNGHVIGCEDCLRNDLYCVGWGVKLYSIQSNHPECIRDLKISIEMQPPIIKMMQCN